MKIYFILLMLICSNVYGQPYQNRYNFIQDRWLIQDEYRYRNIPENYLDRQQKKFDLYERTYEMRQKEKELVVKGILPPKDPNAGKFIMYGRSFSSFYEFQKSPEYDRMIYERDLRKQRKQHEKDSKEYEIARDYAFLRMWNQMGVVGRERHSSLDSLEKEKRIDEFLDPSLKEKNLEEKMDRQFYERSPYLIPSSGKSGLPEYVPKKQTHIIENVAS